MKARIGKGGTFQILRSGEFKNHHCPFSEEMYCGDYCALFGEPEKIMGTALNGEIFERIGLSLCRKNLIFMPEDFEDLRDHGGQP